jgi:hypothetical protein
MKILPGLLFFHDNSTHNRASFKFRQSYYSLRKLYFEFDQESFCYPSKYITMNRVAALLASAEDVVTGVNDPRSSVEALDLYLEPTPIGPEGIQKVVPQLPLASSFHDIFSPSSFVMFPYLMNMSNVDEPQGLMKLKDFDNADISSCYSYTSKPQVDSVLYAPQKEPSAAVLAAMPNLPVEQKIPSKLRVPKRTRKYQTGQWKERYADLLQFHEQHGHLFVPHSYPPNQKLAQWVKR